MVALLPSDLYTDKMIKYYVYLTDPEMIYWRYVNRKSDSGERAVLNKDQEKITDEVFKWSIATLLAPETGGIGWGVVGCAP